MLKQPVLNLSILHLSVHYINGGCKSSLVSLNKKYYAPDICPAIEKKIHLSGRSLFDILELKLYFQTYFTPSYWAYSERLIDE